MNDPQTPPDADTSWRCPSTDPDGGAQCVLPIGHHGRDLLNDWNLHQDEEGYGWPIPATAPSTVES